MEQAHRDLALIDRQLAMIKANPSRANVLARVAVMQPAAHRLAVSIKQLLDAKEQGCSGRSAGPSTPGGAPSGC
jgi:hypothetical protein